MYICATINFSGSSEAVLADAQQRISLPEAIIVILRNILQAFLKMTETVL
jgi:hypothetical protein